MAWRQTYRALEHNVARNALTRNGVLSKFPKAIEDFGNHFIIMQAKRHEADYDPYVRLSRSDVLNDIAISEAMIGDFKAAPPKDKKAFCALVLFKHRS